MKIVDLRSDRSALGPGALESHSTEDTLGLTKHPEPLVSQVSNVFPVRSLHLGALKRDFHTVVAVSQPSSRCTRQG